MFACVSPAPRTLLSMAMQHLRVTCYQDPQTSPCRGAADWLRLCIRPRRPGRYKCRVVQPADRRWPSGLLPDSDRVDRKAHKPAPVFHGGSGRTAARLHYHARAAPLATRLRIGVPHTLDDVLPLFGRFMICSYRIGTLTWSASIDQWTLSDGPLVRTAAFEEKSCPSGIMPSSRFRRRTPIRATARTRPTLGPRSSDPAPVSRPTR